jgi:hypothetical protein
MTETKFPLEFPFSGVYAEHLAGLAGAPFLVAGMLTAGYEDKAKRLVDSCRRFHLPYVIYEVPTVHRSISPKGSDDLRFTKANFIRFLLDTFDKPALYLDVDVYFSHYPEAVENIVRSGYDFAIYNWLADDHTEAYRPIEVNIGTMASPVASRDRFYVFSHSVDYFAEDQLVCSGAVQFYGNTVQTRSLLSLWHQAVARNERALDDHCLDFVYNNYPSDMPKPKAIWLEKSYVRYGFWIHVRPIINHPEIAYDDRSFPSVENPAGQKRYYPERAQLLNVEYVFPRNCVIDTERKLLARVEAGRLVPFAKFDRPLWI